MYPQNTFFRLNKLLPLLLFFIVSFSHGISVGQSFTKITTGDVVNDVEISYGSSWSDYDNDGYLDLFVANYNQNNSLYHNNGNGTFAKITTLNIVNDGGNSFSGCWADYNNDNYLDLFVTNANQNNFLYRNNGNFLKITSGDIVNESTKSWCCAWGDYDNDGYLDLFVANDFKKSYLYKNNGDETFTKILSGNIVEDRGSSIGCGWADYDNDGDLDLFVSNYEQKNFLYNNNGDGTFDKITNGEIVNDISYSRGCSWGDYDNDGDLDLYVTNGENQNNFLYSNNGDGAFTKITSDVIVNDGGNSYSSSWADFDNDGDLDLIITNNNDQDNCLYLNNGSGIFTKVTTGAIVTDNGFSCSSVCGDFNNDGCLDIFVANWDQNNFLYLNNGNRNNWITIKCVGTYSNTSAIGAKVRVKATINGIPVWQMQEISGLTGFVSQNSLDAEFGLADAEIIDSIKVEWPSGIVQNLTATSVNQILTITEPTIYLNIPTVEAYLVETVLIPLYVKFPQENSFSSAEITIGGYKGNLEFIEFVTDSSLTGAADWTYQVNATETGDVIWFAGAEEISGEGILCWMKFLVSDNAKDFIPINLESAIFDNGLIPVDLTSGGINILEPNYGDTDLNDQIQAYDAALILKYLVGLVNFNAQQMANADVSLDTTISALDATLILQYGVGIIDSLPYSNNLFAAGDIDMENSKIQAGQTVEIPLFLNDGDNILSFEGKIVFDQRYLTFKDIIWPDLTNNFVIDLKNSDGEIYIAGAAIAEAEKADGLFATLQFTINNNFHADETAVTLQKLRWNEQTVLENVATAKLYNSSGIGENGSETPEKYSLSQNYPNPFNPTTTIDYSLKQAGPVQLMIYNDVGRIVRILVNTEQAAGRYSATWDGKNEDAEFVSTGIYFCKLTAGENALFTKKMMFIK